jgi:hypothetical protein
MDPLRWLFVPRMPGVPLVRRFQYVGLARSGTVIADPNDEAIVRGFIGQELGRRWSRAAGGGTPSSGS